MHHLQRRALPLWPARRPLLLSATGLSGLSAMWLSSSAARAEPRAPVPPPASPAWLTIYKYDTCPFANKAMTFLEFHSVPHSRVEVNPLSKKEIAFSKSYRNLPLAVASSGEQVNGSDEIVDYCAKRLGLPDVSADEQKWRDFVNARLVKLLPPNIYRTPREALQAFDYIANASNFSWAEKQSAKYVGAVAMYFVAKRALGKYGIKDPRRELYEALDKWSAEGVGLPAAGKAAAAGGVAGRSFHGGQTPDRADLAVFGVVRSIEGNYKTWEDVQANVQPGFWVWYHAVKAAMPKPVLVPLAGQQPAQAVR